MGYKFISLHPVSLSTWWSVGAEGIYLWLVGNMKFILLELLEE